MVVDGEKWNVHVLSVVLKAQIRNWKGWCLNVPGSSVNHVTDEGFISVLKRAITALHMHFQDRCSVADPPNLLGAFWDAHTCLGEQGISGPGQFLIWECWRWRHYRGTMFEGKSQVSWEEPCGIELMDWKVFSGKAFIYHCSLSAWGCMKWALMGNCMERGLYKQETGAWKDCWLAAWALYENS